MVPVQILDFVAHGLLLAHHSTVTVAVAAAAVVVAASVVQAVSNGALCCNYCIYGSNRSAFDSIQRPNCINDMRSQVFVPIHPNSDRSNHHR